MDRILKIKSSSADRGMFLHHIKILKSGLSILKGQLSVFDGL